MWQGQSTRDLTPAASLQGVDVWLGPASIHHNDAISAREVRQNGTMPKITLPSLCSTHAGASPFPFLLQDLSVGLSSVISSFLSVKVRHSREPRGFLSHHSLLHKA